MRCDFSGIGNEAVNDFEAVNVGFVFLHAAEAMDDRRRKKKQNLKDQKHDRDGSPIALAVDLPRFAPTVDDPMKPTVGEVKSNEKSGGKEDQSVKDMAENIVAGFVAEDEERLLLQL